MTRWEQISARSSHQSTSRYPKRLVAHRGPGPEVLLVEASDVDDEGERLARLIRDLHTQGCISRWADVAVLFSSVKYYLEEVTERLASGDRGATPGRHCQECEFRSLCPYSEVR